MLSRIIFMVPFCVLSFFTQAQHLTIDSLKILLLTAPQQERALLYDVLIATYLDSAVTCASRAQYDKALEQYFECLQLKEVYDNPSRLSNVLDKVGLVYYKLEDFVKARDYYERSLRLKREAGDTTLQGHLQVNISLCEARAGNLEKARAVLTEVWALCAGHCTDAVRVEALYTAGYIQVQSGVLQDAEASFMQSLTLAQRVGNKPLQLENIDQLVAIYLKQDRLLLAEYYLKQGEAIAQGGLFNRELINLYAQFAALYKKKEDYNGIADYQEKYILLKDSVFNQQLTGNLMRIEGEYLARENKVQLAAQAQMLKLKEDVITRQNLLNVLTGIIALMLAGLVFLLWRSNRQRKSVNRMLDLKVKERTAALEANHRALRERLEQQDAAVMNDFREIGDAMVTMREVCAAGLKEASDADSEQYLQAIASVTEQISSSLNSFLNESERRVCEDEL